MLVCRSAGAVIEQLETARTRELERRLVRRMTDGREAFQGRARGRRRGLCRRGGCGRRAAVRAGRVWARADARVRRRAVGDRATGGAAGGGGLDGL